MPLDTFWELFNFESLNLAVVVQFSTILFVLLTGCFSCVCEAAFIGHFWENLAQENKVKTPQKHYCNTSSLAHVKSQYLLSLWICFAVNRANTICKKRLIM